MKVDVQRWWESCLTCIRFRKMPRKQEAVPVIPTGRDCWEEVMIDLEGPSNPADKDGCKYTMTYICCLCHGILIEPGQRLTANETRRMFACCIMRSGTLLTLVRSDRGPELKNALMAEYSSLIGLGHRFGTPWRPMEQGLVESRHVETQSHGNVGERHYAMLPKRDRRITPCCGIHYLQHAGTPWLHAERHRQAMVLGHTA